jgi:hypothetical protein
VTASGYVQQALKSHTVKAHAERAHPDIVDEGYARMKRRQRDEIQKKIVRSRLFGATMCVSMSCPGTL